MCRGSIEIGILNFPDALRVMLHAEEYDGRMPRSILRLVGFADQIEAFEFRLHVECVPSHVVNLRYVRVVIGEPRERLLLRDGYLLTLHIPPLLALGLEVENCRRRVAILDQLVQMGFGKV